MLMKGVYEDGTFHVQLVSQGIDGLAADGDSRSPACSADGRFAVFASKATNLTTDAVNGEYWQIFVYDSLRNELKLMSTKKGVAADADCETPAISANGRYVTFTSAATNLGIPTSAAPHLYKA
jgi:Tol biopolymer transport system component